MRIALDIAKNWALALRPLRSRRASLLLEQGYDAAKDRPDYIQGVFREHSGLICEQRERICGNVLEIGPGGNVGVALLFLSAGATSATCIDVLPWAQEDPRVDYRLESIETTTLPDEAFDMIYSHASLEHITNPPQAVRQMARLLRPGGVTTHQIDLRDHRNFDQPLDFLRFSDWTWRAAQSRRVWTNRWRRSDWEQAFDREGLRIVHTESTDTWQVDERERKQFHGRFRHKTLADLSSVGLLIAAVKS